MEAHLSEMALEALAHGRDALVPAHEREHLAGCADCTAAVARTRALSLEIAPVLLAASPEAPDFSAMIATALAASAPAPAAAPVPVPVIIPSRRSLFAGSAFALALVAVGIALSARESASLPRVFNILRDGFTVIVSLFRVVAITAPGGSAAVALVGLVLLAAVAFGLRRLADGVSPMSSPEVYSS